MPKTLFTVGWVLLLLMAAALTLLSINSTYLPLMSRPDGVTSSVTIGDIGAKTYPEGRVMSGVMRCVVDSL